MLEELHVFESAERVRELFQSGAMPIVNGQMVRDWDEVRRLVSAEERRSEYTRVFGAPVGEPGGTPNRDFNDLWVRFVSAASSFDRQQSPRVTAIQQQVHAAVALLAHARAEAVRAEVRYVLWRSPVFRSLSPEKRQEIEDDTCRVARDLVQEIDFPYFVSALIRGTFGAIVNASLLQMEDYADLVRGKGRWDRTTLMAKINRIVSGFMDDDD